MAINRQGIWTSYLIGTPVGLSTVFIVFSTPVILTGEGLTTMAMVGVYEKAILGLIISFLIALGVAGHIATTNLEKQKSLLKTAFKFSLTVNLIIWTVFILLTVSDNFSSDFWLYLIPPIVAFLFCTTMTTFTLGLLICYIIKKRLTNSNRQ